MTTSNTSNHLRNVTMNPKARKARRRIKMLKGHAKSILSTLTELDPETWYEDAHEDFETLYRALRQIDYDLEDFRDVTASDEEACPGCGALPGNDITPGCTHPDGCGHYRKEVVAGAGEEIDVNEDRFQVVRCSHCDCNMGEVDTTMDDFDICNDCYGK